MKMRTFFLSIVNALILLFSINLSAQGWDRFLPDTLQPTEMVELPDGDFIFSKNSISDSSTYWFRLDKNGRIRKSVKSSFIKAENLVYSNDGFIWASIFDNATARYGIAKLDTIAFSVRYTRLINDLELHEIKTLPNGKFLLCGRVWHQTPIGHSSYVSNLVLSSLNPLNNTIEWSKAYPEDSLSYYVNLTNRFITILNSRIYITSLGGQISKFDFEGRRLATIQVNGKGNITSIVANKDQTLCISNDINDKNEIINIDTFGIVRWRKEMGTNNYVDILVSDKQGGTTGLGYRNRGVCFNIDCRNNYTLVTKFDSRGNILWQKSIGGRLFEPPLRLQNLLKTKDEGIVLLGISRLDTLTKSRIIKLSVDGSSYAAGFIGKVSLDDNNNCGYDIGERLLSNFLVIATSRNGNGSFRAESDSMGYYKLPCDADTYELRTVAPRSTSWKTCPPRIVSVAENSIDTIDFAVGKWFDCVSLQVDIGSLIMRRCFENTTNVLYKNVGTKDVDNVSVLITLDSMQDFISASRLVSGRSGQVLRFDIGSMHIGDIGNFNIKTKVRCGDSTRIGQKICMNAHIYPNQGSCFTPINWSGASLEVTGQCIGDSVEFRVRNTGTSTSHKSILTVIEDDVVFLRETIQLEGGQVRIYRFPANGSSWRIIVQQEPNHPFNEFVTAVVENCQTLRTLPFPFEYGDDNGDPTEDSECLSIVGSFDPNIKIGYPIGFAKDTTKRNEKHIMKNQDITYKISFQNTGTDTAFTVEIRDTIAQYFDIDSIQWGASSHPYRSEIFDKRTLRVTFDNINLVDSTRNEAASHGFVKFRIKQKKNLPLGTIINNKAAIYFDYNSPIITNTVQYIVCDIDCIPKAKNFINTFRST